MNERGFVMLVVVICDLSDDDDDGGSDEAARHFDGYIDHKLYFIHIFKHGRRRNPWFYIMSPSSFFLCVKTSF